MGGVPSEQTIDTNSFFFPEKNFLNTFLPVTNFVHIRIKLLPLRFARNGQDSRLGCYITHVAVSQVMLSFMG